MVLGITLACSINTASSMMDLSQGIYINPLAWLAISSNVLLTGPS